MKWKVILLLIVVIGAAFYFGYLKLQTPSLQDVARAMPVQVDPAKKEEVKEMTHKTEKAVAAASKEMKKPSEKTQAK